MDILREGLIACLILACALLLGAIGLFALGLWRRRFSGGATPQEALPAARAEMESLERLAKVSVERETELRQERGERLQVEKRARTDRELLSVSREDMARLGRNLHDGIIQSLYAAGLTLESARAVLAADPAEADRRIARSVEALNGAIRDVRAYITGLSPENIRTSKFRSAVESSLSELKGGRSGRFEVQIDDDAAALLNEFQAGELLQIAREAVSNALRHGRATVVTIRMHKGEGEVCLLVQDNGTGFATSPTRGEGHGLRNMESRAAALGGGITVTSHPGNGARILVTIPAIPPLPT